MFGQKKKKIHVSRVTCHVSSVTCHVTPVKFHLSPVITRTATATDPPLCNVSSRCTVGWTENTQKPDFFEKRKKSSKMQKLQNIERYTNISNTPFDQRSLILREAWFLGCDGQTHKETKRQTDGHRDL